jgi:phenylacetate-CoA ligase
VLNWRKPVIHGLLRITGSDIPELLELARGASRLSPDALRDLHRDKLSRLLLHASRETDYYRRILSETGVVREGTVQLENFERIPFLTKEVMRREGPALRAKTLPTGRKGFANRTGGSTGEPCEFWQDSYYDAGNTADKLFHFETLGKQLGEPEFKIWGAQRDLVRDTGTHIARAKNFLYNRQVESCAILSKQRIREIIDRINRAQPKTLWSYVDGAFAIARYAIEHDCTLHSPAAVFCGGGTLLPPMRDTIETAFRCPAVNYYGSREMGAVACFCPEGGNLHITSHSHVVEVVDEDGHPVFDREGELVLTSLTNYAMPFLRYWIGDRGNLSSSPCSCGSPFPVLKSVSGRSMESLVKPGGELVSPIFLITLFGGTLGFGPVSKFQIVQEALNQVTLRVVVDDTHSAESIQSTLDTVQERLGEVMGEACIVRCERVADIPREPSGKYLYTICKIDRPHVSAPSPNTATSAGGTN